MSLTPPHVPSPPSKNTLVLATHNPEKVREFRSLLAGLGLEILTLDAFQHIGEIVEDADSLEGNAMLKTNAVFRATGLPALGDDTGLEVHYLNGRPGVYSSRYAGDHASYADNVAKLLRELRGVAPRRRAARFRAVLALVTPRRETRTVEGICRGVILESPRGLNGFGYDPVFLPSGHSETLAEMTSELKNKISHRGEAMHALLPILHEYAFFN